MSRSPAHNTHIAVKIGTKSEQWRITKQQQRKEWAKEDTVKAPHQEKDLGVSPGHSACTGGCFCMKAATRWMSTPSAWWTASRESSQERDTAVIPCTCVDGEDETSRQSYME